MTWRCRSQPPTPDTRYQAILAMNAIGHVRDSFKWVGSDTQFHDRIPDIVFIGFQ